MHMIARINCNCLFSFNSFSINRLSICNEYLKSILFPFYSVKFIVFFFHCTETHKIELHT